MGKRVNKSLIFTFHFRLDFLALLQLRSGRPLLNNPPGLTPFLPSTLIQKPAHDLKNAIPPILQSCKSFNPGQSLEFVWNSPI